MIQHAIEQPQPPNWDMVNCPESIFVRINGVCRQYLSRWRKLDNGEIGTISAFQEAVRDIMAVESYGTKEDPEDL